MYYMYTQYHVNAVHGLLAVGLAVANSNQEFVAMSLPQTAQIFKCSQVLFYFLQFSKL